MQQCREKNVGRVRRHFESHQMVCKNCQGWRYKSVAIGWFDAGSGGWVPLGIRQTNECRGDMVSV